MNRLLGQTIYGTAVKRHYPKDSVYVKLRQNDGISDLTTVMKVMQNEGDELDRLNRSNPFFQLGRKDAFWPGTGIFGYDYDPTWYGKIPALTTIVGSTQPLQYMIQNPGKYIADAFNLFEGPRASNYWGANIKRFYKGGYMAKYGSGYPKHDNVYIAYEFLVLPNKTIYDPCPAGYVMPPKEAIFNMIDSPDYHWDEGVDVILVGWRDGDNPIPFPAQIKSTNDEGVTIYNKQDKSSYSFLPYSFARRGDNIGLGGYMTIDYYFYILDSVPRSSEINNIYYEAAGFLRRTDSSLFHTALQGDSAGAVLPYDDSVSPSESQFEFTFVPDVSPSGTQSVSTLGRYTVMAALPELH